MADTLDFSSDDVMDALAALCPSDPLLGSTCSGAITTLRSVLGGLQVSLPTPQGVLDEIAEWKQKAEEVAGSGDGGPGLPVPSLPGGDPMEPLRRLAEAINEAESKLNAQNLVIASGSAEVSLVVEVGGAVAQANVRLDIQPRPFQ